MAGQASKHVRPAASRVAAAIAGLIGALALGSPVFAQSATWLTAPTVAGPVGGTLDFNANANWNPATAPGSVTQTGTATFGASTGTNISFSATDSILDGFTFNAGASNYSFTLSGGTNRNTLVFNSVGIVVNGGSASFTNNGGGASQQFQGARVVARTQTDIDLLDVPHYESRFGFGARLLIASFLQAL